MFHAVQNIFLSEYTSYSYIMLTLWGKLTLMLDPDIWYLVVLVFLFSPQMGQIHLQRRFDWLAKKREKRVSRDIDNASYTDTKFSYSLKPIGKFKEMYLTWLRNNTFEREKPCDKKCVKNLITDRCSANRKLFRLNIKKQQCLKGQVLVANTLLNK